MFPPRSGDETNFHVGNGTGDTGRRGSSDGRCRRRTKTSTWTENGMYAKRRLFFTDRPCSSCWTCVRRAPTSRPRPTDTRVSDTCSPVVRHNLFASRFISKPVSLRALRADDFFRGLGFRIVRDSKIEKTKRSAHTAIDELFDRSIGLLASLSTNRFAHGSL